MIRTRGPESDRVDAYALAEKLQIGAVDRPVFKAPGEFTNLRELPRVHAMLARDVVRVQSRIKFVYRPRAIETAGTAVYSPAHRDQSQGKLPQASRAVTTKWRSTSATPSPTLRAHQDLEARETTGASVLIP